jgi:hypothetical protein
MRFPLVKNTRLGTTIRLARWGEADNARQSRQEALRSPFPWCRIPKRELPFTVFALAAKSGTFGFWK